MFVSGCSPLSSPMTTYWVTPAGSSAQCSTSDPMNLSASASAALYRQELLAISDTIRLAKANGLRASAGQGAAPTGPGGAPPAHGTATAALQSLHNSSLFFTELLYPSVIPLPGTLPQTPGHVTSPGSKSTTRDSTPETGPLATPGDSSPADKGRVDGAPLTRSSELKFGIDRILKNPDNSDSTDIHKERSILQSPSAGSLPPVLTHCPCSAPSCSLIFSPLSYHGSHPATGGLSTHTLSGYNTHRPSEYPGPFALLTSADQSTPNHTSHPGSQQPKRKRSWSRAVFSNLQRKGLEKRFEVQKYVTKPDRRQLAAMLGLTDAQVKVWFQNRRMKWRHQEEAKKKKDEDTQKSQLERGNDDVRSTSPDIIGDESGDLIDDDDVMDDDDEDRDIDVDDADDDAIERKTSLPYLVKPEAELDRPEVGDKLRGEVCDPGGEMPTYDVMSERVDETRSCVRQKSPTSGSL